MNTTGYKTSEADVSKGIEEIKAELAYRPVALGVFAIPSDLGLTPSSYLASKCKGWSQEAREAAAAARRGSGGGKTSEGGGKTSEGGGGKGDAKKLDVDRVIEVDSASQVYGKLESSLKPGGSAAVLSGKKAFKVIQSDSGTYHGFLYEKTSSDEWSRKFQTAANDLHSVVNAMQDKT